MTETQPDDRSEHASGEGSLVDGRVTVVRAAVMDDAERMANLCRQLGYAVSPSDMASRLERVLADQDHAVLTVNLADRRLLGWIHVHLRRSLLVDLHAEIGGLVVDEDCRQRGIGQRLMAEAEAWARAQGCVSVRLRSNVTREEAHQFYLHLGYRELTMQRAFCKDL